MIDGVSVVVPVVITFYNDGIVSQVVVVVQGDEIWMRLLFLTKGAAFEINFLWFVNKIAHHKFT